MKKLSSLALIVLLSICHAQRPPTLIKKPESVTYRGGSAVQLECVTDYEPKADVEYIWKYEQRNLNLNQPGSWKFAEERGSIMVETPIPSIHDGYYQCFAKTPNGQAMSDVVEVRNAVLDVPVLSVPEEEVGEVGQYLKITCQVTKSYPTPQYTWARTPDISSAESNNIALSDRIRVDGQGALHFGYLRKEDEVRNAQNVQELYKCNVYNNILDSTTGGSYSRLTVTGSGNPTLQPPEERFQEDSKIVAIRSEKLIMRCFFSGYPDVGITWERMDGNQDPVRRNILNGGTVYELSDVIDSDAGRYRCTGSNSQGSQFKEFNVKVEARPSFKNLEDQPHDVNVTVGDSVTIKCQADAIPDTTVMWFENGVPIDTTVPVPRRQFTADHMFILDSVCRDCGNGNTDVMVIQCNASNTHGSVLAQGYLNVLERTTLIPPAHEIGVLNVTQEMIDNGDTVIIPFKVEYDPTTELTIYWTKQNENGNYVPLDLDKEVYSVEDTSKEVTKRTTQRVFNLLIHLSKLSSSDDADDILGSYQGTAFNHPAGNTAQPYSSVQTTPVKVDSPVVIIPPTAAPVSQANFPWWIIAVIIVIIILIILIILCCYYFCCFKGDYKLKENEEDRKKALNDSEFQDYSRPDELEGLKKPPDAWSQSTASLDERSLDAYAGEPDLGKFNEDGSFINEYDNYQSRTPNNQTYV